MLRDTPGQIMRDIVPAQVHVMGTQTSMIVRVSASWSTAWGSHTNLKLCRGLTLGRDCQGGCQQQIHKKRGKRDLGKVKLDWRRRLIVDSGETIASANLCSEETSGQLF